ncbi:MAG: hypothetical protein QW566_07605 [Candidatus Jordarchaeales archaeon]
MKLLTSLFIVSSLLLSAFLATAFAFEIPGQPVPEFPVGPEVITGTVFLAAFLALRRKNRGK